MAAKPVLLYDGHCSFCRIWLDYWRKLTEDRIEYRAAQDAAGDFPQIPAQAFKESIQLVRPDGTVASGARAVFESLGKENLYGWLGAPSELAYRFIARRRDFFYQVTRFTFGTQIEPARFATTQWIFLRVLALIYAIAFGSLALQVMGLYGSQGIAPIAAFLAQVARNGGAIRYLAIPSLFWLASDDGVLTGMCFGGVILASILFLTGFAKGRHERLLLFLLYAIYLSYASAGQEFLSFQWDSLLLETGFLAIFLGRNRVTPWLFRWLVFRVYSLSGAVKLLSGDANWRNLSAVSFHWHTQPLPTVLAWYADKLPGGVQHAATWGTLAIELVLPFLIFFPRRIRQAGATGMIALQVLILLTGNYTFFNLLTIALCLFLFDDRTFARWIPGSTPENASEAAHGGKLAAVAGVVIVTLGLSHLWLTFTGKLMEPLSTAIRYTAPLEIVNTYGLFAVMTTQRNEIVLEGSDDGSVWLPYEFHHKPGDLKRAPTWVAPHQPRVDWQMWFAALGNYQSNSWFVNLALRVLEGSPAVQPFFAVNPFPQRPPRFIRAQVYEYKFSDSATHARSGEWWQREARGLYLPAVGLRKAESQSNQQLP